MSSTRRSRSPRTVLEQEIRQRRQTFEEFAEFAEMYARENGETGTLSVRHLQRLAAGAGENGQPLGAPRPATARLLESIFDTSIETLLRPPNADAPEPDAESQLRQMLHAAASVDASVLALLNEQLTATRRLDRQLGAVVARDEVQVKVQQVHRLLTYSITPATREGLAVHLSELCTLAGWQALDAGDLADAWRQYTLAATAAAQSTEPAYGAHSAAGQAFTLIDLGNPRDAVEVLGAARERVDRRSSRLMRSWLAAAHGEALAADGQRSACLHAFDRAAALLPDDPVVDGGPYVVLDPVHLARWRGHALARIGDPSAVDTLTAALDRLDPTFTRAEVGLRVDLATTLVATGEREEAAEHMSVAEARAIEIGSRRQLRRLAVLS